MRRLALACLFAVLAAGSASAGWRDDLKVLKVGFVAGDNPAYEVQRMEPFRWRLQYGLAVPVELFPARSYQALIEAESSGRIQYAILSSLAYVALDQACDCAEPLVQPTASNGALGFRAMLVVREGGPIADLAAAKGSRLAVGARDSISGRIAPYSGLADEGIEPESHFARTIETADAGAALTALADGEVDVAVAWSIAANPTSPEAGTGPIADLAEARSGTAPALRAIWTSEVIPFGPHVVRKDLPPEARAALLDTLLEMHAAAPDAYDSVERRFSGGFVAADGSLLRRYSDMVASASKPE